MIDDEHSESAQKAAEFHAHTLHENVHETEKPSTQVEKSKLDLNQIEQDLFDFFTKVSGTIPEWVPIVPSFLKAKKEQWVANAALRSKNLATGEKIDSKPEALKLFLEKTLRGWWEEGKTALDVILIVGTDGVGNVALGAAEKAATKEAAGVATKITAEGLAAKISKIASGGEGAVFDLLPGFFKGLAGKLERHPEQAKHLLELGKIFEKIQNIPGARPFMEELLAQQEWWQKLKTELQSSQNRAAEGQRLLQSVKRTGFTPAATPA